MMKPLPGFRFVDRVFLDQCVAFIHRTFSSPKIEVVRCRGSSKESAEPAKHEESHYEPL